jgi:aspartate-semialdehyde dehydrogenase
MQVAIVGATGLVGSEMLRVLERSTLPIDAVIPVASERSVGKKVLYKGMEVPVVSVEDALTAGPTYALFSAGGGTSLALTPRFAEAGIIVIDNSSAWRMDPAVPLVVPEVNPGAVLGHHRIIANPNCSTIQMVVALQPLHAAWGLERVIVSTYQSVTGSGQKGVAQLVAERAGHHNPAQNYPYAIDLNLIPHIDAFADGGYTKEELKMVRETRKIMGLPTLKVAATTVRVPVMGGHSESVMAEFSRAVSAEGARELLAKAPGIVLQDDVAQNLYPMPLTAQGRDEVFVGRIRADLDLHNVLNLWIVADNLRKGAATNAVQIMEMLASRQQ